MSQDTNSSESPSGSSTSERSSSLGLLLVQIHPFADSELGKRSCFLYADGPSYPLTTSELSGRIYSQFRFEHGEMRLAGFQVTSRWLLVPCDWDASKPNVAPTPQHVLDQDGTSLPLALLDRLDLHLKSEAWAKAMEPSSQRADCPTDFRIPPTTATSQIETLVESWPADSQLLLRFPLVLAYSVPWMSGKILFRFQHQEVESRFENWIPEFVANPAKLAGYRCDLTGDVGYHLEVDDEGDLGLASSLRECSVSGQKLLRSKLLKCVNSQQWAARSQMVRSALNHKWMLRSKATTCRICGLPCAVEDQRGHCCRMCRELPTANSSSISWEELGSGHNELPVVWEKGPFIKTEESLTWVHGKSNGRHRLLVFDSLNQILVHRVRQRWSRRWLDAEG